MQTRDLDDIMNGIVKEKLGIIPEDLIWGGILFCGTQLMITNAIYSLLIWCDSFAAQSDAVFTYQEGDFMKPVIDECKFSKL